MRFGILLLAGSVLAGHSALATDSDFEAQTSRMVEIRTLQALPRAVAAQLGLHQGGAGGIADANEPFNRTDNKGSQLPMRHFILGGASLTAALVVYEQGGRDSTFNARAFVLEASGWKPGPEWSLNTAPSSLRALLDQLFPHNFSDGRPLTLGQRVRNAQIESRIHETRPARRDGPLREDNISDNEVREIQAIVLRVMPGSILNISGVVTGCPCEEEAACTDQVWIVAHRPDRTKGLQLSRIGGRWTIGRVQQWWLDLESLGAEPRQPGSSAAYWEARSRLFDRFPTCATGSPAATSAAGGN